MRQIDDLRTFEREPRRIGGDQPFAADEVKDVIYDRSGARVGRGWLGTVGVERRRVGVEFARETHLSGFVIEGNSSKHVGPTLSTSAHSAIVAERHL